VAYLAQRNAVGSPLDCPLIRRATGFSIAPFGFPAGGKRELVISNSHEDGNGSRLSLRHEAKRKFLRGLIGRAAAASVAACAMTLPALAQLASPTYVTGSANATFTAAPAAGSTVSCSLSLISNDPRGPSDTNSGSAPVSGSTATCQITMYFRWRLTSSSISSDTMTVAYSVQGPVQSSSGLVNIIPMPPDGTGVNLNIGVTQ
jgi:hypothetical protein